MISKNNGCPVLSKLYGAGVLPHGFTSQKITTSLVKGAVTGLFAARI
jgi:hypothetical protein